jgi:lipid II:glycine glycyltransferase (peptidoglycan interpeptide bridge formation enzyme)
MSVYAINPLSDHRWNDFIHQHPSASVFHSSEWLKALHHTYHYEPVALTTSRPGNILENGLAFCRVSSWLTGRRSVSLPFSDHCNILASNPQEMGMLLHYFADDLKKSNRKYAEIRPLNLDSNGCKDFHETQQYYFHRLDLRVSENKLFSNLHKNSVQRKIHRAQREALLLQQGCSESLMDEFFRIFLATRKRHHLPPQPRSWFKNLTAFFGPRLTIHVASKEGRTIAAILTLEFKNTVFYKYGGSDPTFHSLGGLQALFWQAIQMAKSKGMEYLDFGRTDLDDGGLVTFKDRWGTERSKMTYYRCSMKARPKPLNVRNAHALGKIFAVAPDRVVSMAGKFLYKHMG